VILGITPPLSRGGVFLVKCQVAKAKSPRVTLGEKYPYDIMILILWNANLDFQRENFIICITGALIK